MSQDELLYRYSTNDPPFIKLLDAYYSTIDDKFLSFMGTALILFEDKDMNKDESNECEHIHVQYLGTQPSNNNLPYPPLSKQYPKKNSL